MPIVYPTKKQKQNPNLTKKQNPYLANKQNPNLNIMFTSQHDREKLTVLNTMAVKPSASGNISPSVKTDLLFVKST